MRLQRDEDADPHERAGLCAQQPPRKPTNRGARGDSDLVLLFNMLAIASALCLCAGVRHSIEPMVALTVAAVCSRLWNRAARTRTKRYELSD